MLEDIVNIINVREASMAFLSRCFTAEGRQIKHLNLIVFSKSEY